MLIKFSWVGEAGVILLCDECGCDTEKVPLSEAADMSTRGYRNLCMECAGGAADEVSDVLYDHSCPYILCVDDRCFVIDVWKELVNKDKLIHFHKDQLEEVINWLGGER